jgi:hypothetical protein
MDAGSAAALAQAVRRSPSAGVEGTQQLRDILQSLVSDIEAVCRTGLRSRSEEPGSPRLAWRHFVRATTDSCTWVVGAVSCGDTLCADWVTQDRLAAVSAEPRTVRIMLFPAGALSIGAEGTVSVDSISAFRANDHVLVQARRISTTDHPCYGGPESSRTEYAEFLVLRGARVTQAFALGGSSESSSEDDVDGATGKTVHAELRVSADTIIRTLRIEDWHESPDGDPRKMERKLRTETLRLVYDPRSEEFVVRRSAVTR